MTTSRDAGDDLLHILDELDDLITHARSMPRSASASVNLAEGRAESERLVQYAQEESERLVAGENIVRMANDRADSIVAAAEDKAASLRHGADEYSDRALASLEAEIAKITEQIRAGREVLAGRLGDGLDQSVEVQEPVRRRSGWSVDPSAR